MIYLILEDKITKDVETIDASGYTVEVFYSKIDKYSKTKNISFKRYT